MTIYNSPQLDPDKGPQELQNKVQFDIRFYMMRRGAENIEKMTKNTFQLHSDQETGIAFVKKVEDEQTKNHSETNSKIITGYMPQMLDPTTGRPHKLCPVRSYENYLWQLNPDNDMLWQNVLKRPTQEHPNIYFGKGHLGHNTLDKFMRRLSENIKLSQSYTNHCIRVTGVKNLTRKNFSAKQIMSVSGHKSLDSLAIYQKVASNEKLIMGMSLTYSLMHPEEVLRLNSNPTQAPPARAIAPIAAPQQISEPILASPAPSTSVISTPSKQVNTPDITSSNEITTSLPTPHNALLPVPDVNPSSDLNFNIAELLKDFEDMDDDEMLIQATQQAEMNVIQKTAMTTTTSVIRKNTTAPSQMPNFMNCKIANININIYKQ